jgi:hypothetical protein
VSEGWPRRFAREVLAKVDGFIAVHRTYEIEH